MPEIKEYFQIIDAHDIVKEYGVLRIKIVGVRRLKFRLVIARFLIELAALIVGVDCEIENEEIS